MSLPTPEHPIPGFQTRYPIVAALDLLGRRWILRIPWELRNGPIGFRALQACCDDMSPSLLSQRLSLLQTTGLISHTEESTYCLTGTGQELLQALAPLQAWAEPWAEQLRGQEETESAPTNLERSGRPMSPSQSGHPTFMGIAPRFVVRDLEQALAFYEHLGFQTTYHDEGFAIVERDKMSLHLNPNPDLPTGKYAVCWIASTNIDALYQQYLPAEARQAPLQTKPWGFKEFTMRDPSGNLIIFAEHFPEADASIEQGGMTERENQRGKAHRASKT